mgnify:CR=1 FL=1
MGVVYHPNYLLYFEPGRTERMRAAGAAYADLERRGVFLVVTEARCRYRGAARYDETLTIATRVEEVGKASVRFSTRVSGPDGRLLCEGDVSLASVDRSMSPVRLPADVAALLEKA